MYVSAQEIGPIEKFALSDDRTKFLKELIPGSEEHFYYHVLHYQNEGRLAEGEAMLLHAVGAHTPVKCLISADANAEAHAGVLLFAGANADLPPQ